MDVCRQSETLKSMVGTTKKMLIRTKGHIESKRDWKTEAKIRSGGKRTLRSLCSTYTLWLLSARKVEILRVLYHSL